MRLPIHLGASRYYALAIDALFPAPGQCAVGELGDTIVLTGSIYLIGEVLERIQGSASKNGSGLQDKI